MAEFSFRYTLQILVKWIEFQKQNAINFFKKFNFLAIQNTQKRMEHMFCLDRLWKQLFSSANQVRVW